MDKASFKYTFPILKAESREDGLYLIGFASGPEIDRDEERIAPEAIVRFAEQIEERVAKGDPLPYRDAHAPDGVLMDLGILTKAWVNEHFHLGVEVRLDAENPASKYLFEQVRRGKQYGMSVSGSVLDWADEFVEGLGKAVRTFKNVVLDEISNTTRPSWYPSFGTVLAKSVSTVGENASMDGEELDLANAPVIDETGETDSEQAATPAETEAPATENAEESAETEDVDKAGRSISAQNRQRLLALHNEMTETLIGLGVIESEPVEEDADKSAQSDETSDTLRKAIDEAVATVLAENETLTTQLGEATARIAALENAPRTQLPGAVVEGATKSLEDQFKEEFAKASPQEKLRMALAAQVGDGVRE